MKVSTNKKEGQVTISASSKKDEARLAATILPLGEDAQAVEDFYKSLNGKGTTSVTVDADEARALSGMVGFDPELSRKLSDAHLDLYQDAHVKSRQALRG